MMDSPAIRTMAPDDLERALDWAAAEGWNPGLGDAACYRAADPAGFLVIGDANGAAGSISVVRYGAAYGFLGLYIVRPEHRGRGLGMRLWEAGLAHLAGRTVGLDGVVARQADYARAGFATRHRNIRYGGHPRLPGRPDPRVGPVAPALLPALLAYDGARFGAERERFLRCWLAGPERTARVALVDGDIAGYGVRRACRAGHKVGPLFARDAEVALALLGSLLRDAPGPVMLDVPEPNRAATDLAEACGLAPVFETARMYRGTPPDLPLAQIFGITTLELG
ncbi:GNAT family N-acetyltransferase [Methylobacterium sp. A54F]